MKKTNAMRLLDGLKIPYQAVEYEVSDGLLDALSVAAKTQLPPSDCYKTLVTEGAHGHYVFVIPGNRELDLKKAAKACGEKKIEMLPQKELKGLTGYIHGGCSPLGMKKSFPTYIDQRAEALDRLACSGGQVGLQMVLDPKDLVRACQGHFADLATEEEKN